MTLKSIQNNTPINTSRIHAANAKLYLFIFSSLIYATLSQPTPDRIGVPEILIGICLIISVGISGAFNTFSARQVFIRTYPAGIKVLTFMFLVTLITGSISTIAMNNDTGEAIRDFIPFLYFLQPVLLFSSLSKERNKETIDILCYSVSFVGVVFSIRHFMSSGAGIEQIGSSFVNSSGYYFSTDPSVLFASLYLFGIGISLGKFKFNGGLILNILCLIGAVICLAALLLKGHRGPLGLFFAFSALIIIFSDGRTINKIIATGASIIIVIALAWNRILATLQRLIDKNDAHGLNGRDLELSAVIEHVSQSDYSQLLGMGWGSLFHNPVIFYQEVNFTHLSFSYLYLKAGMIGLALAVIYLFFVLRWAFSSFRMNATATFACLAPLLIGFIINGSFRYITFGWIALILVLLAHSRKEKL